MENVTHAIYMAFAMLIFVVAFTYAMRMVQDANYTSKVLMSRIDESAKYERLTAQELAAGENDIKRFRIVGIDTIIPTLYRYYKESYSVKILDTDGSLLQYFDTATDGKVLLATKTLPNKRTPQQKALISLYGDSGKPGCLFGAPWLGDTNKDTKARIDMYIAGEAGYINETFVDYSKKYGDKKIFLNNFENRRFKETFAQYAYEGDTLTTEDDELETLTGTKQVSNKIVITYQLMPLSMSD